MSKDVPLPASLNEHQIVRKIEADKQKADHEKLEAVSAENPTAVVKPMTSASSTEYVYCFDIVSHFVSICSCKNYF